MDLIDLFDSRLLSFLYTPLGVLIFIIVYAIWVVCLLPGLWPSMLGGFLYGSLYGTIYVFIGAFIGAELTFFIGRILIKNWLQTRISDFPKLQAIQKAVSKEGLRLNILSRLSPVFPFSLLNLAYGLSQVKIRDFTFGLLAILPGTILFCNLGSIAGDIAQFNNVIADRNQMNSFLFSLGGLFATLAVIYLVTNSAKKALQELDP